MLKITPTDTTAEQEGVWTTYMGVQVKIARATNPRYKAALLRLQKQHGKRQMTEEEALDALTTAMAGNVLVDWKPFKVGEEEIAFSVSNAKQLLMDDVDFRQFVLDFSSDLGNYLAEEVENTVGES